MRLSIFIVFMMIVVAATGIGSFMAGAGGWTIALRVIIVLVALQLAYFAVLMYSAYFTKAPAVQTNGSADHEPNGDHPIDQVAESQKN